MFCNTDCLHFPSDDTVPKTSKRHIFMSGDLVHFSKKIWLEHTLLYLEVPGYSRQHVVVNM